MSPTTPSTTFSAYRKRMVRSNTPFLGELVWYTVAESVLTDHKKFAAACKRNDLEKFTPKVAKDADVFRRVCTDAQRKRVPVPGTENFENYLMRDVANDAGQFWKQLVVETVDAGNRRLDYEPVLSLSFDPKTPDKIVVDWIVKPYGSARAILDDVVTHYEAERGKVHAYTTREFIRSIINSTSATVVRKTGGVYFVMTDELDVISNLDALINEISPNGDITLDTVPLIDDARTKEMLRAAFEDETTKMLVDYQREVSELLKTGNDITAAKFADLNKRKNAIKARADEYSTLLGDNLEGTSLRVQSLEGKMRTLFKLVK